MKYLNTISAQVISKFQEIPILEFVKDIKFNLPFLAKVPKGLK